MVSNSKKRKCLVRELLTDLQKNEFVRLKDYTEKLIRNEFNTETCLSYIIKTKIGYSVCRESKNNKCTSSHWTIKLNIKARTAIVTCSKLCIKSNKTLLFIYIRHHVSTITNNPSVILEIMICSLIIKTRR